MQINRQKCEVDYKGIQITKDNMNVWKKLKAKIKEMIYLYFSILWH